MRADVSRIRSNPLLDFAGVELKQGGVLVDADFNEHVAIVDRRLRAAASDILGRGTVSSTTPDAFNITAPIAGDLSIGIGRLYVDGMLAENHGKPPTDPTQALFDSLLGEVTFADPWTYASQPYPPGKALPTSGRHLVYLDVWDREVTHLERPDLVEVALGVESSSRRQTVWQVRVLDNDAGTATCGSPDKDVAGWQQLIAPSSGRLTTGEYEVPPAQNPCELPPTGGYRGLENQLYRVQIHEGGQPGPNGATFKWSRDSVGSRVASVISATELELDSLGRDGVLRFNTNDWVEIIDDRREFSDTVCGEMRKITVDEDTRRITFAPALPADMLPTTFPNTVFPSERNLRARLWHHKDIVMQAAGGGATSVYQDLNATADGTIAVPATGATTLILENGVTVKFESPANGKGFKPGDYWVFAARTADRKVEPLVSAPPRGTHHHFARLGIWDIAAGTVTDCRHPWPPEGGEDCVCTVCVSPEAHKAGTPSLQDAIDQVIAAGGGTICLDIGEYFLRTPLRIQNVKPATSLRIVGKGVGTVLHAPQSVIDAVSDSHNVHLEHFALVTDDGPSDVRCLVIRNCAHACLEHLDFNVGGQGPAVGLSGALADIAIRHCAIRGFVGITNLDQSGAATGLLDLRIEDNDFECTTRGVALTETSIHQSSTRIHGNRFDVRREACLILEGATVPGFGVDVSENVFLAAGSAIVSGVDGLRVTHNAIRAHNAPGGSGVTLVKGAAGGPALSGCDISGNRINGFKYGVLIETDLELTMIHRNQFDECVVGIHTSTAVGVGELSIDGNQLKGMAESAMLVSTYTGQDVPGRISVRGNQFDTKGGQSGAHVLCRGGDIVFADNRVHHEGAGVPVIVVLQAETLIVSSNRVTGRSHDAMHLEPLNPKTCTVLGNLTSGLIRLNGSALSAPWAPFNPIF